MIVTLFKILLCDNDLQAQTLTAIRQELLALWFARKLRALGGASTDISLPWADVTANDVATRLGVMAPVLDGHEAGAHPLGYV